MSKRPTVSDATADQIDELQDKRDDISKAKHVIDPLVAATDEINMRKWSPRGFDDEVEVIEHLVEQAEAENETVYDPEQGVSGKLSPSGVKEYMRSTDDPVLDPADVSAESMPHSKSEKRRAVAAIVRHEHNWATKRDIKKVAAEYLDMTGEQAEKYASHIQGTDYYEPLEIHRIRDDDDEDDKDGYITDSTLAASDLLEYVHWTGEREFGGDKIRSSWMSTLGTRVRRVRSSSGAVDDGLMRDVEEVYAFVCMHMTHPDKLDVAPDDDVDVDVDRWRSACGMDDNGDE
jgi:hypothetical protein